MKKIELCGLSSDMRCMSSLLPSTLEDLSRNNTIKPVFELKVEDDAKEAIEYEKARALE